MTTTELKQQLRTLIIEHNCCMVTTTKINLSSGLSSNVYFDCKRVLLDGNFLDKVSDYFIGVLDGFPEPPSAIGGLTMGADFLTAAIIMKASQKNRHFTSGSIVRKEPKKHGTETFIENELPRGTKIVLIDDVITTGNSILKAATQFLAAGYDIIGVLGLINREQGGEEKIRTVLHCPVYSLFSASGFHDVTWKLI